MVLLYRPIEQFQKLATSTGILYLLEQQLECSLTLIRSSRVFEKGFSDWKGKPVRDITWIIFKSHFKDTQPN